MGKTIIEGSAVLPGIDSQIEYIKHLRKDVIPFVKHLETGLAMISAIEQSLLAAKLFGMREKREPEHSAAVISDPATNDRYNQILNSLKIKLTSVRIEVLKAILGANEDFTASEIYKAISRRRLVSKTAVISTIILFKTRGLIMENKSANTDKQKRQGRPEMKYKYINKKKTM